MTELIQTPREELEPWITQAKERAERHGMPRQEWRQMACEWGFWDEDVNVIIEILLNHALYVEAERDRLQDHINTDRAHMHCPYRVKEQE